MKKPKKITVKPFIFEKLEGIEATLDNSEGKTIVEMRYPLYYMVMYNRNNTKFRTRRGLEYYSGLDKVPKELLEYEINLITKILRYQISQHGDDVNLKGLGRAFEILGEDIQLNMEKYMKGQLKQTLLGIDGQLTCMFNFDDWRNSFPRYYQVINASVVDFQDKIKENFKDEMAAYELYTEIYQKLKKQGSLTNSLIELINGEHFEQLSKMNKKNDKWSKMLGLLEKLSEIAKNKID